jgi:hypothetical protein
MKRASILLLLFLAGCSEIYGVTPQHIAEASRLCEQNGGVERIKDAWAEVRSWRCDNCANGRVIEHFYSMSVSCVNGTHMKRNFSVRG